ncbi:hypothetical protein DKX38_027925 [Salix brachista]|uniref:Uncharacterized protein n=1 Tax=Salix brachista TaxID=2182728 RepID=A0A5N5J498_9ROSI|nr:hypothetical protein DKX38_027925 [Salix brachista]
MDAASGAQILFLYSAAGNFMPIIGAFLADTYVVRYPMIGFGCITSLLAMARLEAMVQRLVDRPPVPMDRGVINQPVARQQPRIARNRAYDDSSDEDSEGEIAGAPENQQQRRSQPEY